MLVIKKRLISMFLVVIVTAITFSSGSNSAYAAVGNFIENCDHIGYSYGILDAVCKKPDGTYNISKFNLDSIIDSNDEGNFVWGAGGYRNSCSALYLEDGKLFGECKDINGNVHNTKISLIGHFKNKNGNLYFDDSFLQNGDDWFYFEDAATTTE